MTTTTDPRDGLRVRFRTYSGKWIDQLDPKPEVVRARDLAHQLALENRFNGATFRPYSDAQHCVLVARYAGGWDGKNYTKLPEARFGLVHDASEAYIKDLHGPLKHDPEIRKLLQWYVELEERWTAAIMVYAYGGDTSDFNEEVEAAVKRADKIMLRTEQRDLCAGGIEGLDGEEPDRKPIDPWSWRTAECEYLTTFEKLFPGVAL
jgi:5'-deoxynucleotidase YfbR-like HD superfamily hydrolase